MLLSTVTSNCASLAVDLKCDRVSIVVVVAVGKQLPFCSILELSDSLLVQLLIVVDDDDYDVHILCCCTVLKFNKCKNNRSLYVSS